MANEKRLIDANALVEKLREHYNLFVNAQCWNGYMAPRDKARCDEITNCIAEIVNAPTVDTVDGLQYDEIVNKLECLLCHATGGQYSKVSYSLNDVERMVTDYIEECCEEAVAEEVTHAQWIVGRNCNHVPYRIKAPQKWGVYRCSACGYSSGRKRSNYCPNCGAKMDGGNEDGKID